MGPGQVACPLALEILEAVLAPCLSLSLVNCSNRHVPSNPPPSNPFPCQGVPHFQAMGKRRAEPVAREQHRCGPHCLASPDPGGIRLENRAWAAGVL